MYFWRTQGRTDGEKLFQIFKYNTKIGRQILLEQKHDKVAARKFWMQEGISEMRLDKFWKMVWHDRYDVFMAYCA